MVYYTNQYSCLPCLIASPCRKEQKKVTKLEAQIPYHEGRGNKEEAEKIRQQIKSIWDKAIEASYEM